METTIPNDLLARLVDGADEAAVRSVQEGRGGPFGAALYVCGPRGADLISIGEARGNAVLETGIASAHAEDRALCPEHIGLLKSALKARDRQDRFVILASSAESCPACHAKIEILARILIEERFLLPGHFIVAFGAGYEDTKHVAGFNDALYHEDMIKPIVQRLIKMEPAAADDLPAPVSKVLSADPQIPAAVVLCGDDEAFAGYDGRAHGHFTLTPEISAIRAACDSRHERGYPEAWNLGGAALYTFTKDPGPLAYAECQWANVMRWVTVRTKNPATLATQEAPGIKNSALFDAVTERPYNNSKSVLRIVKVACFANLAQKEWRRLSAQNPRDFRTYNGIGG